MKCHEFARKAHVHRGPRWQAGPMTHYILDDKTINNSQDKHQQLVSRT